MIAEDFREETRQELIKKLIQRKKEQNYDYLAQVSAIERISKSEEDNENYELLESQTMSEEFSAIAKESLSQSLICRDRTSEEIEMILSKMFCVKVMQSESIWKEGDRPVSFFIIEKGSFDLYKKKKKIASFTKKGELVGDSAAIFQNFRNYSPICTEDAILWGINISYFQKLVREFLEMRYNENRSFLDYVRLFDSLKPPQKDSLSYYVKSLEYSRNDVIIAEGDKVNNYPIFFVKSGKVKILINNSLQYFVSKEESFGENSLFHTKRTCTAIADSEKVELLTIERPVMDSVLGDKIQNIIANNIIRGAIEHSASLSNISWKHKEELLSCIEILCFSPGDLLVKGDAPMENLYIVIKGSLVTADNTMRVSEGSLFGEEILFSQDEYISPWGTLFVSGIGMIGVLTKSNLKKKLGNDYSDTLKKSMNPEKFMGEYEENRKKDMQTGNLIYKKDIIILKEVGEGISGIIYLVKYQEKYYALKIVSKGWVLENNLEKYMASERAIYDMCYYPLITKLYSAFKDDINIYFMSEFIKGVEFFDMLRTMGVFPSHAAQFYSAAIFLAVHYLHLKGIIHRDIKPENLVVDEDGYPKLLHLASAKHLPNSSKKFNLPTITNIGKTRTYTVVGTPHYCSPEMILQRGYSFPIDYWSIGVCLFEFLCGFVPFGEELDDPLEIYKCIIRDKVKFPDYLKDKHAKNLIKKLLHKSPEARLQESFGQIQSHSWFANIDWDGLQKKSVPAPLLPSSDSMISNIEIERFEKRDINLEEVVDDIQLDELRQLTKTIKPRDSEWDSIFDECK